jgi:hypothetical protein
MKNTKTTPILNGAYEVIGLVPGLCGSVFGMVDLSRIKADMAEKLIKAGFPYLRRSVAKKSKRAVRKKT